MKIKLQYPYKTAAGKEINMLEMRRPIVKDLRKAKKQANSKDEIDFELTLLSSICNMVPEDFENMDQMDYMSVSNAYLSMVEGHSKSNEKPLASDGSSGPMVSDATI